MFFLSHVFLFFHSWEEGKKEGGGGVTWYLLVAIPHPPDVSLTSPGMMGVLDVAGWQERFSAKTYTTQKCLYLEERRFFKASPIIWFNWSYMDPIICGVRVIYFGGTTRIASQSNIVTERPTSVIRYTPRSSTQKKRVVQQRRHLHQTHGKFTALRLVGDACRCT